MQKLFYQHLIQFLISLAVGTLSADALLHLLPHAYLARLMGGPEHHKNHNLEQHTEAVWLGCVALLAMIGFFFIEKIIAALVEMKKQAHSLEDLDRKLKIVREGHMMSDMSEGRNIVCKNRYSSYCAKDLDLVDEMSSIGGTTNKAGVVEEPDHDLVIISQHEVLHHGHSHAHAHLHSAPKNISSVAWMVIFGDGFHNLADGLAIGAAFADGFMSGFSTSLAVLCHELPHEIGDFALLLKAGMSIKQAVFYNVVSSFLAFIGMVAGLLLGTINNFSPWMFTATAGIFLYVALVDMMPELSSGHAHPISRSEAQEGTWVDIVLQMLGMSLGMVIMLLIALYEHDLKGVFSDTHL